MEHCSQLLLRKEVPDIEEKGLLRNIGFKYKQVNDKLCVYEHPHIIVQCHEYLRQMRKIERKEELLFTLTKHRIMHEAVSRKCECRMITLLVVVPLVGFINREEKEAG